VNDLAKDSYALGVDALLVHTAKYVDRSVELIELSYVGINLTHKSELGSTFFTLASLGWQRTNISRESSDLRGGKTGRG